MCLSKYLIVQIYHNRYDNKMDTKPIEVKYLPQVLESFCWFGVFLVWVGRVGLVGPFLPLLIVVLENYCYTTLTDLC